MLRLDELASAGEDGLQHVSDVEPVDQAECSLVQGGELPAVEPELLLRPLALGDVEQEALGVQRPTRLVAGDHDVILHPDHPPVLGQETVLGGEGRPARIGLGMLREHASAILRMEHIGKELGVAEPRDGRVAEERFDLRADVDRGARLVEVVDVGHERELLDQAPVPALGRAQPALGLLALVERASQRAGVLGEAPVARVERFRDLTEDGQERRVEEDERESQRDPDGCHRGAHVVGDRPVVEVHLEGGHRLALAAQRHERLDRLQVPPSALLLETRHLPQRPAGERGLQVGGLPRARADHGVVVRVGEDALSRPELDQHEVV